MIWVHDPRPLYGCLRAPWALVRWVRTGSSRRERPGTDPRRRVPQPGDRAARAGPTEPRGAAREGSPYRTDRGASQRVKRRDLIIFGPTAESFYWSSTTFAGFPFFAWVAGFHFGGVNFG